MSSVKQTRPAVLCAITAAVVLLCASSAFGEKWRLTAPTSAAPEPGASGSGATNYEKFSWDWGPEKYIANLTLRCQGLTPYATYTFIAIGGDAWLVTADGSGRIEETGLTALILLKPLGPYVLEDSLGQVVLGSKGWELYYQ